MTRYELILSSAPGKEKSSPRGRLPARIPHRQLEALTRMSWISLHRLIDDQGHERGAEHSNTPPFAQDANGTYCNTSLVQQHEPECSTTHNSSFPVSLYNQVVHRRLQ